MKRIVPLLLAVMLTFCGCARSLPETDPEPLPPPETAPSAATKPADVTQPPAETAPLMLIRPVSGSGALAVGTELITTYGPDSLIGRVAAVMLGSTETTFYTIAVYFGSAGIRKTRHAIPAALIADFTGFVVSAWAVRWIFP